MIARRRLLRPFCPLWQPLWLLVQQGCGWRAREFMASSGSWKAWAKRLAKPPPEEGVAFWEKAAGPPKAAGPLPCRCKKLARRTQGRVDCAGCSRGVPVLQLRRTAAASRYSPPAESSKPEEMREQGGGKRGELRAGRVDRAASLGEAGMVESSGSWI